MNEPIAKTEPTRQELEEAHCWFSVDHVSRDPATTAWKRAARLRQAQWREQHRWGDAGTQPYRGGEGAAKVGSRLELASAIETGHNFITPAALDAAKARMQNKEKHEMLNTARLWADLLSSMPLCFNLFGELTDRDLARAAVRAWWPELPHGEVDTRFEWSPGRLDLAYLGNRSAFDACFEITAADGTRTVVGVETKYHEHAVAEAKPSDRAMLRYAEVTEKSGAFVSDWRERILGTDLQQIWLDHLLLLSMLQHPTKAPARGLFVLACPAFNPSFVWAAQRYRDVLTDASTFQARTLEELVDAPGALPAATREAFRARYL